MSKTIAERLTAMETDELMIVKLAVHAAFELRHLPTVTELAVFVPHVSLQHLSRCDSTEQDALIKLWRDLPRREP